MAKRSERFIPASTECTQPQINNFIWSIDNSNRTPNNESEEKMKLNLERLSMRRKSVTAGRSRNKDNEQMKTQARTLHVGHARCNTVT